MKKALLCDFSQPHPVAFLDVFMCVSNVSSVFKFLISQEITIYLYDYGI